MSEGRERGQELDEGEKQLNKAALSNIVFDRSHDNGTVNINARLKSGDTI